MDLTRLETFINEKSEQNAEILADLETLKTQNSDYDTYYETYKNSVTDLTEKLRQSNAENIRLVGLVNANPKEKETSDHKYEYDVNIFK